MKHINADQLRDYKFDLLSEADAVEATAHLEACAECREQLQALESQFGALDVLQDQPAVSDETVAAILTPAKKKAVIIPFWKPAIAVAASLFAIFGILRMADQPDGDRTAGVSPAQQAGSRVQPAALVASDALPPPSLAALRAEQPFAPASNIELNVLPRRDEVQVTIYNQEDLTLVREKRTLVLNRGWNWLQFMWSNTLIDPTSLELEPKTHTDQIEITQLVYPPRLNDLARWTIFSETDCEAEFELTYFTSGLKWNAFYEATLSPDEQSMEFASYVRVDNHSGEDYEDAQTRLVVGKIKIYDKIETLAKREPPYGRPRTQGGHGGIGFGMGSVDFFGSNKKSGPKPAVRKRITKKRLSEYQLYTIEGRETIPDGWGKRLPSFTVQEIGVTNLYKFEAERWGDQTMRFLSFANTEAHQLGETPLPKGRVRMFGSPGYVGAADIKYIPVGEEVELELGPARKVMVEPKLMRVRNENYQFDQKGNVSGWDEIGNWKLEITNTKGVPVEVEIMRAADSTAWEIKIDAPFEKYDANHFRFTTKLEPHNNKTIEYELTVHHGTRKDAAVSTESDD